MHRNGNMSSCTQFFIFVDFKQNWNLQFILLNVSSIKFYENRFSGSRAVSYAQTEGQTDVAKVIGSPQDWERA
jgi:hypothetical protein